MKFITIEKLEKLMQDLMEKINNKFVTEDKFTNQMAGKSDKSHTHDDIYYTESEINTKVSNLQKGIDDVAEELTDVNSTLNGYIGEAFGVLTEHQGRLNNHESRITHNEHVIDTIQGEGAGSIKYIVDEAVGKEEERAKSAELALQTAIDGKADISHGTHVEFTAITPSANGTASVGTSSKVARADHIHPLQTTVNGVSFWTGTQAEYNAISSKSSTTLYFIID